jgi:hypothetical protein
MTPEGQSILGNLKVVAAERQRRQGDSALEERVRAVKHFQHDRFQRTYADLLAQPRYASATRFFLDDLYGPRDFTQRDAQFVRIVPALVRLFPQPIVQTVRALSELHALSETLDTRMAALLPGGSIDMPAYARAWQAASSPEVREQQIALMLSVGQALERYTRNPLLSHSLRLMRGPARAAGLAALQSFLEVGFETFRGMHGASEFLSTIAARERALAAQLFALDDTPVAASQAACETAVPLKFPGLGQLP